MSGDRDRWRAVRPLAHRDFRLLFAAVVLALLGAGMWAVVMVYAVIAAGGGPAQLSIVAAANAIGLIVCVVPGGIAADRFERRQIIRAVEAVSAVAAASVALAGVAGGSTIAHLAIVSFVIGAAAGFFFPSYSAMLPRILPEAQLLAANGLESAVRPALQQAAGPAAAGVLLAALVPSQAALGVVLAHAAAFVVLLFVRREPAGQEADAPSERSSILRDLREAVSFTVRTPWLLATLLFATAWVLVSLGPEEVLLPFLVRERIGDDPRLFAFLLAAFGLGGLTGSLVVSSLKLPRRYLTAMMTVWGVSTLPYAVVAFTDSYVLLLVCGFAIGFAFAYGNVIWGTLLQRRVPRHMLGRVSSLDFFVSLALMPVSMAIAGPLAAVLPLSVIFFAAGGLPLGFAVVAYVAAGMRRDEITHPLENA